MITDSKTRVGPWAGEESQVNLPHGHHPHPPPPPQITGLREKAQS